MDQIESIIEKLRKAMEADSKTIRVLGTICQEKHNELKDAKTRIEGMERLADSAHKATVEMIGERDRNLKEVKGLLDKALKQNAGLTREINALKSATVVRDEYIRRLESLAKLPGVVAS